MVEKGKKMPKYIERDSFVEWLKNIPLKDLSDGLGLCRVIMEDDFKRAIKNIPESIIHDYEVVVRSRDCIHAVEIENGNKRNMFVEGTKQCELGRGKKCFGYPIVINDGFCDQGERKYGD